MDEKLIDKINNAFKEDFVGDVIFIDSELASIYDYTSRKLRTIKNERGSCVSYTDFKIIFVALVNITKEWNSDSDAFFDYIFRRLLGTEDGNGKVYNQFCNVINKLSGLREIFILNSFQKKYYATLICHAFAPITSIESFFDMCWAIYCKDLDYFYSKDDPVFKLISEFLKKRFSCNSYSTNEEELTIGSIVYSFRAGIKGLALDETERLTRLVERTIRDIDCLFNSAPVAQDKYYEQLINQWWKKKEKQFGEIHNNIKDKSHKRIICDYSQIKPRYILYGTELCIEIPSFRLLDDVGCLPYIKLIINNENVLNECMPIKESVILTSTNKYIIHLKDYYGIKDFSLDNIEIEIVYAGKSIYDSKNFLNRKFVLFKDVREILSNNCIPGQYYLFIPKINSLSKYPEDICKEDQFYYSFCANEGESLQYNEKIVFFSAEKNEQDILIYGQYMQSINYIEDGEEYSVVDGDVYVDVFNGVDDKDYGVKYNGVLFKLSDFPFSIHGDCKRYIISSLLKAGEIGTINVFKFSKRETVQSLHVIKFNNINIQYDKHLYYDDCEGFVEFKTEKFHEDTFFNPKDDEVYINFKNGELQLFPPKLGWKIGEENKYNYSADKKIWWKNMNNSSIIDVKIPKDMNVKLFLTDMKDCFIERLGIENKFKIGQTIHAIALNNQLNLNSVKLIASLDDKSFKLIAEIYLKECFAESPVDIDSDNKKMYWDSQSFVGNPNTNFFLRILKNGIDQINLFELKKSSSIIDLSILKDGHYELKIVSIIKGWIQDKEQVLYRADIDLGNKKNLRFIDKSICINEVMYFGQDEPKPIRPLYIDNIRYLTTTKDGFDLYSGNLYIRKNGEKVYLDWMKDKNRNEVKINPIRIELMNNISLYMGYGLDLEDPDFEYDNEFSIDRTGRIIISNSVLNTPSPDYYRYKEEK